MAAASRGETVKNSLSKASGSSMKPPKPVLVRPSPPSGDRNSAESQRSAGTSPTPSPERISSSQ